MKCKCCHNEFDEVLDSYVCSYCGFDNEETDFERYRDKLIGSIRDINILVYKYCWNPSKKDFDETKTLLSDKKISGYDVQEKGHIYDINMALKKGKKYSVTLTYTLEGTARKKVIYFNPLIDEAINDIRILLDDNLHFIVCIGLSTAIIKDIDVFNQYKRDAD